MLMLLLFVATLIVSGATAWFIVCTKDIHGTLSMDSQGGVQKLHKEATPRIGGISIIVGVLFSQLFMSTESGLLCSKILLASIPAFAAGLTEDLTKQCGALARFVATILSGALFVWLTGYGIEHTGVAVFDLLLRYGPISLLLTAIAVGGVANALNLIDGVHGLAAGTAIIIATGFALVAMGVGDMSLVLICIALIAALSGFLLLNFPLGRLFLGDGGAYATGFALAAIAVALVARNESVSALTGLLGLSYPVIETLVSIQRRIVREGSAPDQPDRLHLHSLTYRYHARRLARLLGMPEMHNPMTSVILWTLPLTSSALMILTASSDVLTAGAIVAMIVIYLLAYRKVALLSQRPRFIARRPPAGLRPNDS